MNKSIKQTDHRKPDPTAREDRVPVLEKMAYGCGEPVYSWGSWVPTLMANQVFNMTLGLSPILISVALVVFRLWDAITDPVMGWISDNFRSRFGRRRPFIFLSSFLIAIVFPLMWLVNPGWSHTAIIAWFIGIGLVYFMVQTIGNIPYQSLLLEMSPDYNERTSVAAYRALVSKIFGLGAGWVWYLTQLPMFADPETGQPDTLRGMQGISVLLAVVFLVLALMPALFTKERYYNRAVQAKKKPLVKGIKETLRNRPFRLLAGFIIVMCIGTGMVQNFGAYVLTYYVYPGSQQAASVIQGWGTTGSAVVGLASLPLITYLSKTIGKEKTLMCLLSVLILLSLSMWFSYNPHFPWLAVIPLILTGPINGALWILIPAMLADIVDYDELSTSERREGSFSSVFAWVLKLAITIGIGISGPLLTFTGFDADLGGDQPAEVLLRMRIAMVAAPSLTCFILVWMLTRYPLNPGRMHEIRSELERRRGKIKVADA